MENYSLGEFEELILLVVAGSEGEAYGVSIQENLIGYLKKNVNISAIHVSLKRLEEKGFVRSKFGGITEERGGRRKKFYTITPTTLTYVNMLIITFCEHVNNYIL